MRGWSSIVKKVAGHELKARIDVRVEKDQMATGQEARTGRPEAVLQCSLGLQISRGSSKRWRERSIGSGGAGRHQPEGVCASIAVIQGESRQRDGSMSFADRSISARRSLS